MRRHILLEDSLYSYFSFRPFFREKKSRKDGIRRQALKGQIAIATLQQKN